MTVRVTTLKGVEAGRYYTKRLPGYYLDGGEPPGRWWGNAAEGLGLSSQVDPEAFLAVMAGLDPMSGERNASSVHGASGYSPPVHGNHPA